MPTFYTLLNLLGILLLLACAVASIRHLRLREWSLAAFFAAPVVLVVLLAGFAYFQGRAIRAARQEAMERGDIPANNSVASPAGDKGDDEKPRETSHGISGKGTP